jgi:hypothetical protein
VDPRPPSEGDPTGDTAAVIPIRGYGTAQSRSSSASPQGGRRRHAATRGDIALVLIIAAAAGVAGGIASGAPTGLTPLDVALKALLPAVCVVAGRRTAWPFVALAACIAAAASYDSPAALVAVAVLGLALGGWRSSLHLSQPDAGEIQFFGLARAAMCGALADIALRATWPRLSLAPSLLAACIVLLLLVPAVVTAPRRIRRLVMRAGAVVVLAGLLLSIVAGFSILLARSPLRAASADTGSALKQSEHGNQSTAIDQFKEADEDLHAADGDLDWAVVAEIVPVVSQQVRAIRTAASAGTSLVQAGFVTASSANVGDLRLVNGTFPVARLQSFQPLFKNDLAVVSDVRGGLGPLSSPWVVGPLRAKLNSEQSKVQEAQHDAEIALLGSEEIPGILGSDGMRRYLVLVENPAESRAGGGVVGDYAEVTADEGRLRLVKVGSVEQLDHDGVPPLQRTLPPIPDFVDRYSSFYPQDNWENVSMSPDFPTVGAVAQYLYPQSGGVQVNGVISLDPVALAGLVKMIGSVTAPPLLDKLGSNNVVAFLANQEFVYFKKNGPRISFVENLLRRVWRELTTRRLPPLPSLVKDLVPAVKGGHLMMYSSQPAEEHFFKDVHVAGAMPRVVGDFVGVVTQNAAGNKIDWYIRRKIAYDATVNLPARTITSTLTVTLHNSAPSSGLPPVIIDGLKGIDTKPGEDLLWVSVYSPWLLESATVNGKPVTMTSQYELGRPVYGTIVPIFSQRTAVLQLHLSGTWPSSLSHYVLGWYHQPVLYPDQVSVKDTVIP